MKIAIIYHSESGNTKNVAENVLEGVANVDGIEVKAMDIIDIDKEFVSEAKAVIVGGPIYSSSYSWQI